MKTRFIMIRHGFSVANNEKRFAGHADFPLTELGLLQAERCAEALKDEKIDAIYASDLKRAFSTAIPVAKSHGLEVIPHKGLREIYAGKWEGEIFDELSVKFPEDFNCWRTDVGHAKCTDGESVAELFDRIISTLEAISAENEGKTVCIATHATPIRVVTTASMGGSAGDMTNVPWASNASLNIFDYEDGKFTSVALSVDDHLGDLSTSLPPNV